MPGEKKVSVSSEELLAMFKQGLDTEAKAMSGAPVRFDPKKGEGIDEVPPDKQEDHF